MIGQELEKLEREAKVFKGNRYEAAMKPAVLEALASFCRQNAEFAQAVVQGGAFSACMAAVAKGIGASLSDKDVYQRAAAFYFPGAEVEMEPKIRLEPEEDPGNPGKIIDLNLSDFFS